MPERSPDPRVRLVADHIAVARGTDPASGVNFQGIAQTWERIAVGILADLDMESTDATVRRLQQELHVAWGNDEVDWDLDRARMITTEIMELGTLQGTLKAAFRNEGLDGGWKAALDHPMYLKAQARIESLREELKGLI